MGGRQVSRHVEFDAHVRLCRLRERDGMWSGVERRVESVQARKVELTASHGCQRFSDSTLRTSFFRR